MRCHFAIKSVTAAAGGAERVLRDVACALAERGHTVSVVSFDIPSRAAFYHYSPAVRQIRLGIGDTGQETSRGEVIRRVVALNHILRKDRPDVAVGFMHSTYVPLALAAAPTRIPIIASEHNAAANYEDRRSQRALIAGIQPLVRATTVLSERVGEGFSSPVRRKAVVIPDPVALPGTLANLRRDNRRRRLLAVGSLTPQKDHATLIAAFGLLLDRFPEWDLRIVGDGELRSELEAQISSLGMGGRVDMPGTTDSVGDEYLDADLFVIPSRFEGFGLVTAEALVHGLPCVGFADCPGTDELIGNGYTGLLVDPHGGRDEALADGLAALMADEQLRADMGAQGPTAMQRFRPDEVVDRWERMLTAVSSDGRLS